MSEAPRHLSGGKSAANWTEVMNESGGRLGTYTDQVYARVEKLSLSEWHRTFIRAKTESRDFEVIVTEREKPIPGVEDLLSVYPSLTLFNKQYPPAHMSNDRSIPPLNISLSLNMRKPLLAAAEMLKIAILKSLDTNLRPKAAIFGDSTDLTSSIRITIDNIQTMLDVESLLSRFAETPAELRSLMGKCLQVCPNDKVAADGGQYEINPRGYTYLELFSFAPFGFWAMARTQQPESCHGVRIVHPENQDRPIDPKFIFMLTREKPQSSNDRKIRHGGCPAMHPQFRKLDLINRLGRIFLRATEEFTKNDVESQKESSPF